VVLLFSIHRLIDRMCITASVGNVCSIHGNFMVLVLRALSELIPRGWITTTTNL
jgi:hypothetical protein